MIYLRGSRIIEDAIQEYRFILKAPRHISRNKHTRARNFANDENFNKNYSAVLRAANGVATPSATAKHQRQRQLLFC